MNAAVALGVTAATAVLTGALLVGDSMRGSLRELTLDRLGPIDEALVADRFFRTALADELDAQPAFHDLASAAVPAILLEASLSNATSGTRANRTTLLGINDRFPTWGGGELRPPAADKLVLNQPLADLLGVKAGDDVLLRLPTPSEIPRDSALGRKTETITSRRLTVERVIVAEGPGRFSLRPNQSAPLMALVAIDALQEALKQPGRANAIFVTGREEASHGSAGEQKHLQAMLHPKLDDFGLHIAADEKFDCFNLTSDRMLLDADAERSALTAFGKQGAQPVFTYLANTLAVDKREIPYSTVAGIDLVAAAPLGPWKDTDGKPIEPIKDGEIVLNRWAADDLQAKPGDTVRVTYFLPESVHGAAVEMTRTFTLVAVCAMEGPAVDPTLTPTLPGVTDQLSIADWNPPFPFDSARVRKKDEAYWDEYRATPKAFVNLATARKYFGSRFGDTTSIRVPPGDGEKVDDATAAELASRWKPDPAAAGFVLQPVKQQGLAASSGTTPFDGLFLGFSMFIIAAALMLVLLLFRLGIEQRAREIGTLRAIGHSAARVRRWLLGEGLIVAALGGAAGTALGVGYAWLMVEGLRTWWVAAIATPFLQLHATATSVLCGYLGGVLVAAAAILWALRSAKRAALTRLLAGDFGEEKSLVRRTPWISRMIGIAALAAAMVVSGMGRQLSGEAQAGAFFGAGALVLVGLLALVRSQLRQGGPRSLVTPGAASLARLALRNGARNPGRSTLSIGLVASASFLILAISAFHLSPPSGTRADTGTGGFDLVAESNQPIYQDLNREPARYDLGFSSADEKTIITTDAHFYAFRVHAGDDASCLNLYRVRQPRVLGVPTAMIVRGGFAWAASDTQTAGNAANPWRENEQHNPWLLMLRWMPDAVGADATGFYGEVPVVLDYATAVYSLHLSGKPGDVFEIADGRGQPMKLRVVGLLRNSIFQGSLLISEEAFLRYFPDTSGYGFFLIETRPDAEGAVATMLDRVLGAYGFDARRAADRLAGYLVVQNTYLETFQSLGGLGLLLGTFGLATVQLRNVLERRGELALLRAVGWPRARLGWLVMFENAALLVGGLALGAIAAAVALMPHLGGATQTSVPWASLAGMLGAVLVVGLLVGLVAVRAVLAVPVLEALRRE
jgi:ABC-type lipoprotein release transport system permease subunit